MKAEMTPRERLLTALNGGVPDRVPCAVSLTRWTRYHRGCMCPRHLLKMAEDLGYDSTIQYGHYPWQAISNDYVYAVGGGYNFSANGQYGDIPEVEMELRIENRAEHVWTYRTFHTPAGKLNDVVQWARPDMGYGDGPNPHRVEPLVKTTKDLDALRYIYPPPRKDLIGDIPLVLEEVGERALLVGLDCTHVGAWGMESLGPEGMLLASVCEPELLHGVCRITHEVHLRNLEAMLKQGIGVIYDIWFECGPSVGWSLKTYRDFFLPLIKESIDLTHSYGGLYIYQDDGKMKDIIPYVVEAGADAVSGLQPPDVGDVILKDVKNQFGDKVALMGGLDPCYTFDFGSPDRVREATRQAIEDAGAGGGYVLGTGEAAGPETTFESLLEAARAAKEFGTYG